MNAFSRGGRGRRTEARIASVIAVTILTTVASSITSAAAGRANTPQGLRYRLVDLGTFGGPNSAESTLEYPYVNNAGMVVGSADTATPNPGDPEGFVWHAYRWRGGSLTDLGTLPGGKDSEGIWSNTAGEVAGLSENGKIDPLLGIPEGRAVLWRRDGQIMDLGTLGGNESLAGAINGRGQVGGVAANRKPDPFSLFGWGTQTRAFLWDKGVMRDLGTLGGPDAELGVNGGVNARGQVAGMSYTRSTPNADTGIPTLDPFLWTKGTMVDLGTLGGTYGWAFDLNDRGQVAGFSALAGNRSIHPFLWTRGRLRDLGTLGGSFGVANWLNNAGEVVGGAATPDNRAFHAFFWRHGRMTDLGTVGSDLCSVAHSVNASGEVVGTSGDQPGGCNGAFEQHGFLSVRGGPMIDLNRFVPASSDLTITDGETINNRGEIGASGMLPNGDFHAVVLVPCRCGRGCLGGSPQHTTQPSAPTTERRGAARLPLTWIPKEIAARFGARYPLPTPRMR